MKRLLRNLLILALPSVALLAQPANISVSPSSGTGVTQSFTFTATSSAGYANFQWIQVIINSGLTYTNACAVYVWVPSQAIYLIADSGSGFVNNTSYPLGSNNSPANSQCTLAVATSSVGGSGNTRTLTLAVTFKPSFAGTQNVYMEAGDVNGSNNWQQMGTWTTTAGGPPSGLSVNPPSGTGNSATFTAYFSDPQSAANIVYLEMTLGNINSAAGNCSVLYIHGSNQFSLSSDTGPWRPYINPEPATPTASVR